VRVGSTTREKGGVVYGAKALRPHPEFSFQGLNLDVGVVELNSPILYGPNVQPLQLVGENQEPTHGEMLEVTGWGLTRVSCLNIVTDWLPTTVQCVSQRIFHL